MLTESAFFVCGMTGGVFSPENFLGLTYLIIQCNLAIRKNRLHVAREGNDMGDSSAKEKLKKYEIEKRSQFFAGLDCQERQSRSPQGQNVGSARLWFPRPRSCPQPQGFRIQCDHWPLSRQ